MSTIAHRETLQLAATIEQLAEFIVTPERILDYYPGGTGGTVLEAGKSYYCHSDTVISLMEVTENRGGKFITLKVTSAPYCATQSSAEQIRANAFFTMYEDWELQATGTGCQLIKTWRDIEVADGDSAPMQAIVKDSAIAESSVLVRTWNQAAKRY